MILVVDDNEEIRHLLFATLNARGYEVLTCCDGFEAIRLYEEHLSDLELVIMDVTMPMLSGIDAMGELRKISQETPIVIMNGYFHDLDVPLIQKPFTQKQVLNLVS